MTESEERYFHCEIRTPREKPLLALDLVKLHLMLQSDYKNKRFNNRKAEKMVDNMILDIIGAKSNQLSGFQFDSFSEAKFRRAMNSYKNAETIQDKAAVLTTFLNVMHKGGNPIVLGDLFGGVPTASANHEAPGYAAERFLENLNNLGGGENGQEMKLIDGSVEGF